MPLCDRSLIFSHSGVWHRSTRPRIRSLSCPTAFVVYPLNGMKTNIYNIYTCSGFVYSVVERGRGGQDGLEWDCWTSARKALSVCVLCVCFFVRLSKRQSDFRNRGYLALKGIFLAYTWWNNNSGSDSGNTNSYTPYTHRHQAPGTSQISNRWKSNNANILCIKLGSSFQWNQRQRERGRDGGGNQMQEYLQAGNAHTRTLARTMYIFTGQRCC